MKTKKLLTATTLFLSLTAVTAYSQTNVFPTSGNVGIGTTNPLSSLDVYGWQYLRDANYPLLMLSSNNSSSLYNVGIHFDGSGSTGTDELRFGKYLKSTGLWQTNPFRLSILAPDGSFVMGSNGNIGFGTTAPQFKLHVNGSIMADGGIIHSSKSTSEGGQFNLYNNSKQGSTQKASYALFNMTGSYGDKFSIWNYPYSGNGTERFSIWDNGDFIFLNKTATPTVYILDNGKVGIALPDQSKLTLTDYKLFVKGGIITEKIKVATYANWADYVFASDYNLKSLNEVENFISQNKHLPNIPSAKEINEQGIDLAEMQAKQMEKIEELTLYLIEQSKRTELQNKEIQLLKQELSILKNNIK